jgi:hypothetical protein
MNRLIPNLGVAGSNPAGCTKLKAKIAICIKNKISF